METIGRVSGQARFAGLRTSGLGLRVPGCGFYEDKSLQPRLQLGNLVCTDRSSGAKPEQLKNLNPQLLTQGPNTQRSCTLSKLTCRTILLNPKP